MREKWGRTWLHKPNNNYSWLPIHTHCTNQMLCAKERYPTRWKTLYGTVSWTTFPALTGKSSGCSWCWHFHSRFPSGTLVPSDSHLLSRPLSSTDTADLFHALQIKPSSDLRDPPSFPQTHCNCRHKNWAGRLPMNGSINCQSHRETTTCCSTALLWLLTDPVNLLAWLELWRMWALPAFPRVSNDAGKAAMTIYCTVKYCWQNTPTLDKDGSSLVYTFLPQTVKVRDTKLPVLWHAPIFKRNISIRIFPHPSYKGINLLLLIMNTDTFFSPSWFHFMPTPWSLETHLTGWSNKETLPKLSLYHLPRALCKDCCGVLEPRWSQ